MYNIRCKESGDVITSFNTYDEALECLKAYEKEDMEDEIYSEDFYEIYNNAEDEN